MNRSSEMFIAPYKFARSDVAHWNHTEWTAGVTSYAAPPADIPPGNDPAYILPGNDPAGMAVGIVHADQAPVEPHADEPMDVEPHADELQPYAAGADEAPWHRPDQTIIWFKRYQLHEDGSYSWKWFSRAAN